MPERIAFINHISEQVRELINQMDEFDGLDFELGTIYEHAVSMQEELDMLPEEYEYLNGE